MTIADYLSRAQGGGTAATGVLPSTAVTEALERLFRDHAVKLKRTAVLLVSDEGVAEEVVQDAFLGLHRRWQRKGPPDDPVAYLRTSVVNASRSSLRRRKVAAAVRVIHRTSVSSAEDTAMLRAELAEILTAIEGMSRRQREMLVLRFYLDLDDAEIARVLGVSRGTVSSTISRALGSLRGRLGEEQE